MWGCKNRAAIRHVDVRDLILGFNSLIIIWFQLRRPCGEVCCLPPLKVRDLIPGFKDASAGTSFIIVWFQLNGPGPTNC
jgi:hypothetical protein